MLKNKNIILGITGGIAAYKAANLTRLFIKQGANIKIIMTPMAKQFITPLTLATLSKNPILVDFFSPENGNWNSHVDLGLWADAYVIAPATANSLAKMANGIADNLLLTTFLSARCPVFAAPTMDLDMYKHPATQNNISILKQQGVIIIDPDSGELASGLDGKGRMAEPETIVAELNNFFGNNKPFNNKNVLITAGPTFEPIDPVRFIGNHSSGKMGFAIAECFANLGANVTIIAGPVSVTTNNKNITRINVVTANQMLEQCKNLFEKTDIAIMAAAVADYRPKNTETEKIKREQNTLTTIELVANPDIAATLGSIKKNNQILAGFALETTNGEYYAKNKLIIKNLDFIVLNSLTDKGAGFKTDTNKITIITQKGDILPYNLKPKTEVASDIVEFIKQNYYNK